MTCALCKVVEAFAEEKTACGDRHERRNDVDFELSLPAEPNLAVPRRQHDIPLVLSIYSPGSFVF